MPKKPEEIVCFSALTDIFGQMEELIVLTSILLFAAKLIQ
jgi:hypothetical protein